MEIRCPYCEKTVQVPGGGQFTCPNCRAVFAVDLAPPSGAQAPTLPSPPPLPGSPPPLPGSAPPSPPPQGAGGPACAKHPDLQAVETCKRCGNFMCASCAMPFQAGRFCPDCMPLVMGGGYGGVPGTVAWEVRDGRGLLSSFWATFMFCLKRPEPFWRSVQPDGPMGQPMGFLALSTALFTTPLLALEALVAFFFIGLVAASAGPKLAPQIAAMGGVLGVFFLVYAVLAPAFAVVSLFINAALYHLVALICGCQRGYGTTLKINAYAIGSIAPPMFVLSLVSMFFGFIPCIGLLVNLCAMLVILGLVVWMFYIQYLGFKVLHNLSDGMAFICVAWIVPFGCCISIGLMFALMSALAGAPVGGGGF